MSPRWETLIMLPAFEWWRAVVDLAFLRYTGRLSYDLPIPEGTWRVWWTAGTWTAQRVAEVLSDYVFDLDRQIAA